MSSPLAIAAVTAALKDLLNDGLLNHDLSPIGSFSVTALPPDRVTTGQNEPNQLNLFLYQVTPNLGWRNVGLPSRDTSGARLSSAPLALDLHYLLTAYGSQDLNAEVLLGYAMQLLHETPVLTREQLRIVLGAPSPVNGSILPSPFGTLSAADLADQVELIKITPVFLSTEDLSKMWTAMQARYRPTMAYMASVVLIQSTAGARVAPPVLKRGQEDGGFAASGSPSPTLASVRPAASELLPAMRLGDDLLVTGTSLNAEGTITALFEHTKLTELTEDTRRKLVREVTPAPASSPTRLALHVPGVADDAQAMSDWAVGFYTLSLRVTRPNSPVWTTNGVPIALAPLITVSPHNAAPGNITVTVTCTPRLRSEQEGQISLLFGMRQFTPQSINPTACDLRLMVASDGNAEDEIIRQFKMEFDSKKEECAVLIVRAIGHSEKWTLAGFDDTGEFRTVVIDDPSHPLAEELKREPVNKSRIIELATSSLGRTLPANTTQPTTLSFTIPAVEAGEYLVRLRVEGIDSLPITLMGSPPKLDFDPQQKVTVA